MTPSGIPDASADAHGLMSQAAFLKLFGITGTNTGDVTIGAPANGLSVAGQVLSLALAGGAQAGAMGAAAQAFNGIKTFNDGVAGPAAAPLNLISPLGVGAFDVGVRLGSSLARTSNANQAKALSIGGGIGGSYEEVLYAHLNPGAFAGVLTVNSRLGTHIGGLNIINNGAGDTGIFFETGSAAGGVSFGLGTSSQRGLLTAATNRTQSWYINSGVYSGSARALYDWQAAEDAYQQGIVFARYQADPGHTGDLAKWFIGATEKAALNKDGVLTLQGGLVVSGFPNSQITSNGSVVDIGNSVLPVRSGQYFVANGTSTAFYAAGNGGFSAPVNTKIWSETLGGSAGQNCVVSGALINSAIDAGARLHAFGKNLANASPTLYSAIMGNGEFEHFVSGAGIVLKSPDGTRYRLSVPNGGASLTITAL